MADKMPCYISINMVNSNIIGISYVLGMTITQPTPHYHLCYVYIKVVSGLLSLSTCGDSDTHAMCEL